MHKKVQVSRPDSPWDRVGYHLKRAQQALHRSMEAALSDLRLSTAQYAVLTALADGGAMSGAELARRCFVTPQTMNGIIVGLVDTGWIERRPHPAGGRVIETHITARGRSVVQRAHRAVESVECRMLEGIPAEEQARFKATLQRCTENLG